MRWLAALADGTSLSTAMLVGGILCDAAAQLYIPAWRAEQKRHAIAEETMLPSGMSDSPA